MQSTCRTLGPPPNTRIRLLLAITTRAVGKGHEESNKRGKAIENRSLPSPKYSEMVAMGGLEPPTSAL